MGGGATVFVNKEDMILCKAKAVVCDVSWRTKQVVIDSKEIQSSEKLLLIQRKKHELVSEWEDASQMRA